MVTDLHSHRRWTTTKIWGRFLVLSLFFATSGQATELPTQYRPLVAAVHVHSTASTGSLTLEELAVRAEQLHIEALLLTENLALHYEYGIQPFESAAKISMSFRSLNNTGIENYLKNVEAVQGRHPKVLLIPGVEVAPYYFWSGSLLDKNLTMHNAQRNLLVFGLTGPQAYRTLPAIGNFGSYHNKTNWVAGAIPALLVLSAVWVGAPRLRSAAAPGWSSKPRSNAKPIIAGLLVMLAAVMVVTAWPLTDPPFSPYEQALGFKPYQALIDAAAAQGGMAFWSLPEARDFRRQSLGPAGTITIKTDPHPEALLLTERHHGFGGLYQEARTAHVPGGVWDQLLDLYQTRQRSVRPAMIGEIAFHSPDHAKKELDQVLTVFWVRERTAAGVLEALREGRAYAVERYKKEFRLQLDRFTIRTGSSPTGTIPGDRIQHSASEPVTVSVRVSTTDQTAHPVAVRVIRSGQVITKRDGSTPLEFELTDQTSPASPPAAYRLEVTGGGVGELLSNPIYVSSDPLRH